MTSVWVKAMFILAAVYDGILGLAFLLFGSEIFRIANVTPPNDIGYIQFPALLLIVFAVMFYQIARNPPKNRELMLYGAGLKASYAGVVFWHQLSSGIPMLWIPWAWADLVFLILFLSAWKRTAARS
jgi:hypothetical protein